MHVLTRMYIHMYRQKNIYSKCAHAYAHTYTHTHTHIFEHTRYLPCLATTSFYTYVQSKKTYAKCAHAFTHTYTHINIRTRQVSAMSRNNIILPSLKEATDEIEELVCALLQTIHRLTKVASYTSCLCMHVCVCMYMCVVSRKLQKRSRSLYAHCCRPYTD